MEVVKDTRIYPEVPPRRKNNFTQHSGLYIIYRIKYLIVFQAILGINRLYLLNFRKCALRFSYSYNMLLVIPSVIYITVTELYTASQFLYKSTVATEYLLLALSASLIQRKKFHTFFSNLQTFDEHLNICDDINVLVPRRYYILGIIVILMYSIFEHVLYILYAMTKYGKLGTMYVAYICIFVHDIEIVFVSALLVMVSRRLHILRAHVIKMFATNISGGCVAEINKLEALSKKIDLDIKSLHNVYDILYKCSEQLNSAINFSLSAMIVAAGLSTIMILKGLIFVIQTEIKFNISNDTALKVIIAIGFGRSLKYLLLLIFPCYFSNVTKTQVDIIRAMVYDVLNTNQMDKVERRKLKAFCQRCHDNAFLYELWGVVRLDMSLPLSYSSLCITYLIILIQFSKFID